MIFYTIGNTNLNTVELVAKVIGEKFNGGDSKILKVVLLNTIESSEFHSQQSNIYRRYLGDQIRVEEVIVNNTGLIDPNIISYLFQEKSKKIIDITNGQKTTAALLYMVASLLDVELVFYIKTKSNYSISSDTLNKNYEYIQVPIYNDLPNLAKISQFDLIYYISELNKIFDKEYSKISHIKNELINATNDFFEGKSAKNVIISATSCEEVIRIKIFSFLQFYHVSKDFSSKNNIDLTKAKDPIGGIDFFFRNYSKSSIRDESLSPLVTSTGLLSALRNYRNLAAHSATNAHEFQREEARIAINLSIELFRIIKASPDFWKYIIK